MALRFFDTPVRGPVTQVKRKDYLTPHFWDISSAFSIPLSALRIRGVDALKGLQKKSGTFRSIYEIIIGREREYE